MSESFDGPGPAVALAAPENAFEEDAFDAFVDVIAERWPSIDAFEGGKDLKPDELPRLEGTLPLPVVR